MNRDVRWLPSRRGPRSTAGMLIANSTQAKPEVVRCSHNIALLCSQIVMAAFHACGTRHRGRRRSATANMEGRSIPRRIVALFLLRLSACHQRIPSGTEVNLRPEI